MIQKPPANPIPAAAHEAAPDLHAAGFEDDAGMARFSDIAAPGTSETPADGMRMDPSVFTMGMVAISTTTVYLLFYGAENAVCDERNGFHVPCEAFSTPEFLEARRKQLADEDDELEFHVRSVEVDRTFVPFGWMPKTKPEEPTPLS